MARRRPRPGYAFEAPAAAVEKPAEVAEPVTPPAPPPDACDAPADAFDEPSEADESAEPSPDSASDFEKLADAFEEPGTPPPPRKTAQELAAALIVLALLIYWNRKLRHLNRELAQANDKLAAISITDQLTGVGNRTYYEQMFEVRFDECRNANRPYLVAMIDADYFKRINDQWGHEAGDACLMQLADILKSHFTDFNSEIIRFGGEEFVIFATMADSTQVEEKLERLRAKVEETTISFETLPIKLTISIGYCCATPQKADLPQQWFRAADRALYDAKDAGRNCVIKREP